MFLVEKIPCVPFPRIQPDAARATPQRRFVDVGNRLDALFVFAFPSGVIRTGEARRIVHPHRDLDLAAGTGCKPQPCVRFTSFGQNRHHGPIAATKDPLERLFVHATWFGRVAGMCV
ncbi:MAG: hypothetical protein CMJ48_08080 [Planctomycetaceae bacterium]|nr:hypothetical protein [Planctomycetaceae bacterium]